MVLIIVWLYLGMTEVGNVHWSSESFLKDTIRCITLNKVSLCICGVWNALLCTDSVPSFRSSITDNFYFVSSSLVLSFLTASLVTIYAYSAHTSNKSQYSTTYTISTLALDKLHDLLKSYDSNGRWLGACKMHTYNRL